MVTQSWHCPHCNQGGAVEHERRAGIYEVLYLLEDDHARVAPYCQAAVYTLRVSSSGLPAVLQIVSKGKQ